LSVSIIPPLQNKSYENHHRIRLNFGGNLPRYDGCRAGEFPHLRSFDRNEQPRKLAEQTHSLNGWRYSLANSPRHSCRGENRSFDNVFAAYTPSDPTQTAWNLLSQGIVLNYGTPGPNVALAAQQQATDTTTYQLSPTQTGPFANLPQPSTTLDALPIGPCGLESVFCNDIGLDPTSQGILTTRGTGQSLYFPKIGATPVPDCRYPSDLPNAPYSLVGASELNNCGQPFLADTIANTTYTSNTR
jgi:hypothetical protein